MLKNLTTKGKLLLLPLVFVMIVIVAGTVFHYFESITAQRTKVAIQTEVFLQEVLKGRILAYQFLRAPTVENAKKVRKNFMVLIEDVSDFIPLLSVKENRDLASNIITLSKQYIHYFDQFSQMKIIESKKGLENESKELLSLVKDLVQTGLDLEKELNLINRSAIVLREEAKSELNTVLLLIAFLSISFFITLSLFISHHIITSLNEFKNGLLCFFNYLSRKTNTVTLLTNNDNDEFGMMSSVVNENILITKKLIDQDEKLIEEAKKVIARVKHGWYSQNIEASTENKSLNAFKDEVNGMIDATKNHFIAMNSVLDEYSKYDYRKSLQLEDIEKGGVFDTLVIEINRLKNSINEMLVDNKANGLTLDKSSDILLKNVDLLNSNANSAAVSLEETAAALEEVTSNISSNTTNIIQMAKYANSLRKSACDGQDLATQTTQAMNAIDDEVTAINKSISVIDQIAFQTNILSLNAAVEAATAGEAGKGFAVVAAEVRNLASRSAAAASEIKTLVEAATRKANSGKVIADKMIDGYNGLNENITKTIALIHDVEAASKEQLLGINQINDAVTSLDSKTQQNASIASQTYGVAVQTDIIAKLVVSNADQKEFVGKQTVQAKAVSTDKAAF